MTDMNKAIYRVLTTQFKKEAKDAHKAVEAAGYEIYKLGGEWHVRNPQTGKAVHIEPNRGWYTRFTVWGGARQTVFKSIEELTKYDFEGQLKKEYNNEWYDLRRAAAYEPTQVKYRRLKSAKRQQQWREERVTDIEKKIAQLQRELIEAVEDRTRARADVEATYKALGLKKR